MSEKEIGLVLSASGFFYVFFQYVVYSEIVNRFGLLRSIYISIGGSLPLIMFIPLSYCKYVYSFPNTLTHTLNLLSVFNFGMKIMD